MTHRLPPLVLVASATVGFTLLIIGGSGPRTDRTVPAIESPPLPLLRVSEPSGEDGPIVLYDFAETEGDRIFDRSDREEPLHLQIEKPNGVRRRVGALEIVGNTRILSREPARKLTEAIQKSGAITIEVWAEPANDRQEGPARLVTLSKDTTNRSFTVGQERDRYDVRFRSAKTDRNGMPSVASPSKRVKTRLTHIAYTREPNGRATLYLDGKSVASRKVTGDLKSWDRNDRLGLGNEISGGDRLWRGTLSLVAIYDRALDRSRIERHFRAGPDAEVHRVNRAEREAKRKATFFETRIASILANRCLECHDSVVREGGLDLSKKTTAFVGDTGRTVIPGNPAASPLWTRVHADEMPEDREPLSNEQKNELKAWIADGAVWTLDRIDPAIYIHEGRDGFDRVRRLTVPEYIETVRATTGVEIGEAAREILPKDLRADGFANTAYNLTVDLAHVQAYARLAEIIADRVDTETFAKKFTRQTDIENDRTLRELIDGMGRTLLRGPLDEADRTAYLRIGQLVADADGTVGEATGYLLEAMLQSPRFLYRIERRRGSFAPVGPYELASRLSYLIWGGPPDDSLLDAAASGRLTDEKVLREQVARMLDDPRAIRQSREFLAGWLHLDRLSNLRPSPKHFPNWSPELADDMRAETLAFFEEIAWKQNRPLTDLLDAQVTFLTPRLARHYGLKPIGSESDRLSRYDLNDVPERGGLLTQGSLLTVGGDEASMVARGLFVLHDLLRGVVKDPPPGVDTTPVPTEPGLTQRTIAEARVKNVSCGGCHSRFEPLAYGLERFDGIGQYRERDHHGNKLRADGVVLIPGESTRTPYRTSAELMTTLAESERVAESFTWKVAQFAIGRPLVAADAPIVQTIHAESMKNGHTWRSLITAIAASDLVRRSRTE